MKDSKGKFVLNTRTINKILKSDKVMEIAVKEANKIGTVEEQYIGTQRVWVKGEEK